MELIRLEKKQFVASITINRPEALNALNTNVLKELNEALTTIEKDDNLRVLIIRGAGDKAFVAGADIKEMESLSPEEAQAFAEKGQKVFRRLEVLNIPVIAEVNGFALGGGLELAMACDFIYASESAVFGLPEVSLGLMPGFGGTQRLAKYVGIAKAKEMTYSAAKINAEEAKSLGLVNAVYPLDSLSEAVQKIAAKIASLAPLAVAASKGAINQGYDLAIDPGMHLERSLFAELFRSKDVKIGIQSFIKKEKPAFLGD